MIAVIIAPFIKLGNDEACNDGIVVGSHSFGGLHRRLLRCGAVLGARDQRRNGHDDRRRNLPRRAGGLRDGDARQTVEMTRPPTKAASGS